MAESRTLDIEYHEFWLLVEDGHLDTSSLSVCGWCSAIVTNEKRHTDMHSCGCSPTFRVDFQGDIHEPGTCPLAEECAESPPCGGCDGCQLAQATHHIPEGNR